MVNAYKYTQAQGRVNISYELEHDRLLLRIQDTGMGIMQEDFDKIFSAYYRSAGVADIKGDGIGLYIVRENIQSIKGRVFVESVIGEGSTFTIDIPINPTF